MILDAEDTPANRQHLLPGILGESDHNDYTRENFAPNEPLLSDFTHCDDSGRDLEGRYIFNVANEVESQSVKFKPDNLLGQVRAALEPNLVSAVSNTDTYFLPWTRLHTVLSYENVKQLLSQLPNELFERSRRHRKGDTSQLASRIAPPLSLLKDRKSLNGQFRRAFAALILVGREKMIYEFVKHRLNDGKLLNIVLDLDPIKRSRDDRSIASLFADWTTRELKDFKRYRWELSPTFFSVKWEEEPSTQAGVHSQDVTYRKRVQYRMRNRNEILPFEECSYLSTEPKDGVEATGGYGVVSFYQLHQDQQHLPRFTVRLLSLFPESAYCIRWHI